MSNRLLIFIPTYNEAENIRLIYTLINQIQLPEPFDILFLDDNSPDGTGKIIDEIVGNDAQVFVIHRQGKQGIGSAHQTGIQWAYQNDYTTLITMDCDLTHSPEYLHRFYTYKENNAIVIGSRYLQKDSLRTWNMFRKTLTHSGHFLTKYLLGMPYDASGAFRLYNLQKIDSNIFKLIESKSYSFFFESLLIFQVNQLAIQEIPIVLPKRTYGNSKMSLKDAWTSLNFLFKMFYKKNFRNKTLRYDKNESGK